MADDWMRSASRPINVKSQMLRRRAPPGRTRAILDGTASRPPRREAAHGRLDPPASPALCEPTRRAPPGPPADSRPDPATRRCGQRRRGPWMGAAMKRDGAPAAAREEVEAGLRIRLLGGFRAS